MGGAQSSVESGITVGSKWCCVPSTSCWKIFFFFFFLCWNLHLCSLNDLVGKFYCRKYLMPVWNKLKFNWVKGF